MSCQQFVSHDRQRILVACRDRLAIPVFGSQEGRGATNVLAAVGGPGTEFGDTEIGEEQIRSVWVIVVKANEEVGRFHILVNDLMVVCILESGGGLPENMCDIIGRERL